MKSLSLDLRQRIAEAFQSGGASQAAIADRFAVSLPSVERIARKLRRGEDLKPGISTGRKPRIPPEKWQEFEEFVRSKNDWTTLALTEAWQERTATEISESSVARTLVKIRFTFKKNAELPENEIQQNETSSGSK